MTKFHFSKTWCKNAARLEDGSPIGAGVPDYKPLAERIADAKAEANSWKSRRRRTIALLVQLGVPPSRRVQSAMDLVRGEVVEAAKEFKPANSAHEQYAVLLEEMDELKAEVWKNQATRDYEAMAKEAVQVAAMAIRFLTDVCFVHPMTRGTEMRALEKPGSIRTKPTKEQLSDRSWKRKKRAVRERTNRS